VAERKSPSAAAARAEKERLERERQLQAQREPLPSHLLPGDGRAKHLHISSAPSPILDDDVDIHRSNYDNAHVQQHPGGTLLGGNDVKMSSSSSGEAFVTPVDKSPVSYVSAKSVASPRPMEGEPYSHRQRQSKYPSNMSESQVERGGLMSHGWKGETSSRANIDGHQKPSPRAPRSYSRTPSPGKTERRSMERVHSRESISHREIPRSSSREKSPASAAAAQTPSSSSAMQRRESWRERSKSPRSRHASRTSRLDSEDNNNGAEMILDQNTTTCDPTKPLSPSLRRRRFHERKVPIARRSSSMSIGDPTDTYRAVRPFKSVEYGAYDGREGGELDREKKTIMVTDLDHAEVEMSKASQSTPNLSDLNSWSGKDSEVVHQQQQQQQQQLHHQPSDTQQLILTKDDKPEKGSTSLAQVAITESEAKIAAAVEDIDGVFLSDAGVYFSDLNRTPSKHVNDKSPSNNINNKSPLTAPPNTNTHLSEDDKEETLIDLRDESVDDVVNDLVKSSYKTNELPLTLQTEGAESLSPANIKNPLKSASASQLDVEKHVSKPSFIPEKVDFRQLEKFEGAMLINWFATAFEGDVYISQRLSPDDLKVISSQFCTHLMAAGVLEPLERLGNAHTRGVFRMDEMYHWARSEVQRRLSVSSDSTPSKIDVTQWPPAVASLLAAEKEKQLLEVGKLKREKMEAFVDGTAASATSAAAEADYQSKLARLEEKIQLLSGEIERYQVLSGIEGLGSGGGAVGENRTSVTTSTTDLQRKFTQDWVPPNSDLLSSLHFRILRRHRRG